MKGRANWVLDETDSLNYIPRTINNLRLLSNELRIRGIISELDFYKVLSYAEVYYRCTNDPSHIQCREGYDVDNELPSRYYPEYHNLNYTFSRYVNEIVNPEISKLRRVNRRYMVKYIQLRTAQDEREHLNRSNVNEANKTKIRIKQIITALTAHLLPLTIYQHPLIITQLTTPQRPLIITAVTILQHQ